MTFDDFGNVNSGGVPYTKQAALEQSILIGNGNAGIVVGNNLGASIFINSTTTWGNVQFTSLNTFGGAAGELNFGQDTGPVTSAIGNVFQATLATQNSNPVYGSVVNQGNGNVVVSGNYIFGVGGQNTIIESSPGFSYGTNTLATPNFVSPAVPGVPNCTGFATTTACMATVIANFTAQAAGAAGLGYQSPGACTPDALFPIWLKGIVPNGIITKPCGM